MKSKHSFAIICSVLLCLSNTNAQWKQTDTLSSTSGNYIWTLISYGSTVYAGTSGGVFVSTDQGGHWKQVGSTLTTTQIMSLGISGNILFATTNSSYLYCSSLDDTSWIQQKNGLTYYDVRSIAAKSSYIFVGLWGGGIGRSTDNGANWTMMNSGLTSTSIRAMAIAGDDIFAGAWEGDIFRSTDNGQSWYSTRGGPTSDQVYTLAVGSDGIFAGTTSGVLFSSNSGSTWIPAGLSGTYIQAIILHGSFLFAGTPNGVYVSNNNGSTWSVINDGLPSTSVWALCVAGTNLYAGTWGKGVWSRPLSEVTTGMNDPKITIPSEVSLKQNYPNPFNPTTTISFHLSTHTHVSLKILDIQGKELAQLISRDLPSGDHTYYWNTKYISSGVYFYRLDAGNFSQTKKCVVLR